MLVWCMMIVACTVPASGLMRYWFSIVASPPYYGARADLQYDKYVLPNVPADLVLSKDPRSVAAKRFFEENFRPVRIARLGEEVGFLTGYYEPELKGSRTRQGAYQTPLYAMPPDLVTADLGRSSPAARRGSTPWRSCRSRRKRTSLGRRRDVPPWRCSQPAA